MGRFNSYLKFLYKSSNQHGVHSPFVYSLLTKGLYKKSPQYRKRKKSKAFVERVFRYFKVKNVAVINHNKEKVVLPNITDLCFKSFKADQGQYDAIWIQKTKQNSGKKDICLDSLILAMSNDSFIILDKAKGGSNIQSLWYAIQKDDRFTVTIDFYYYGLAFIRQEQLKQHFILRM
ncbi:hypothetical protein [Myroides sp. LJL119]